MSDGQAESSPSIIDTIRRWYHVPALLLITLFMLGIRLTKMDTFTQDGEIYFAGNDAWYHLRQVQYTVNNWPATMPFDPWTNFPYGTSVGQFGTLYDQIIATAALVVGLGSPSNELVAQTLLVAPAFFGALTVIPTYLIGKRLTNRGGGIFAAIVLMLLPGTFLRRGLVGFADHNIAEPFFQSFAVVCFLIALWVADREKPVWELVETRAFSELREPALWAALAGVATALYMWAWPPGVLLVGVFGTFVVIKMTSDYINRETPEPIAFVAAVSMGVTGVLMLVPLNELSFGSAQFSLLQPVLSFGVGAGAILLAWIARYWDDTSYPSWGYPATVFGLIVVSLGLLVVLLPSLFETIQNNFMRTFGFGTNAAVRTIGEAQPFLNPQILQSSGLSAAERIMTEYGFTLFVAVGGAILMFARPLLDGYEQRKVGYVAGSLTVVGLIYLLPSIPATMGDLLGISGALFSLIVVTALIIGATLQNRYDSEHLFVLVWAAFLTSAAFTQVRFNYYLAVPVAVLTAYVVVQVSDKLAIDYTDVRGVSAYQVLVLLSVVFLVLTPVLVVPISLGSGGQTDTAWQAAQNNGPGSVVIWNESLGWMQTNTPQEGQMGGASSELEYYGTYKKTEDFSYPDGAYGVMSWWDYGHWITVLGERIPNANPFQEGATEAANFLLAPDEQQASAVLARQSQEGNETRYVMVDWQMVSTDSKFGAPTVWYDESNVSTSDFYDRIYKLQQQNGQTRVAASTNVKDQRYYESLMVRLYKYHGSARDASPVVVDWEERSSADGSVTFKVTPSDGKTIKTFDNMSAARAYVERDGTAQIGGVGDFPEQRVEALDHYRLVKSSNSSALRSGSYQNSLIRAGNTYGIQPQVLVGNNPAWVKTFERVPGATVEGSGAPANSNVTAQVKMRDLTTNTTFTYTQHVQTDENGEFTMTLPYSTTGYDEYGPENGYTNVSVRATGDYTFTGPTSLEGNNTVVSYRATNVSVDEGLVNGAEDGSVDVTLERSEQELTFNDQSSNNSTSGSSNDSASVSSAIDDGAVAAAVAA